MSDDALISSNQRQNTRPEHPSGCFIAELLSAVEAALSETDAPMARWNRLNSIRERYRKETAEGYSGARISLDCSSAADSLRILKHAVEAGIHKAIALGGGLLPTYLTFDATEIQDTPDGPLPAGFRCAPMPLFLAGPVRYLKLALSHREKQDQVYVRVSISFHHGRKPFP